MLTALILVTGTTTVLVLVLLAVVMLGIKQEPPGPLASRPPNAVTALVRRLLGICVRKPDQPPAVNDDRGDPSLFSHDPTRWPKGPAA